MEDKKNELKLNKKRLLLVILILVICLLLLFGIITFIKSIFGKEIVAENLANNGLAYE